jgi:hypothetical protein
MTILDYYKYASLATAAYVRAGPLNPLEADYSQRFAELARQQNRLPLSIAERLFVQSPTNPNVWQIAYYHGADSPGHNDDTGFVRNRVRNRVGPRQAFDRLRERSHTRVCLNA